RWGSTCRRTVRKRTCMRPDRAHRPFFLEDYAMKLLKAIIRPDKVDAVKAALTSEGVTGMTVTEVRGHGKQKGHTAVYRGQEYQVSLLPKMQIEVVIAESIENEVVGAI